MFHTQHAVSGCNEIQIKLCFGQDPDPSPPIEYMDKNDIDWLMAFIHQMVSDMLQLLSTGVVQGTLKCL